MTKLYWFTLCISAALAVVILLLSGYYGITKQDILTGIIIGIASGLTTTAIVLALRYVIKGGLNPWIENLLYKDAQIEGFWLGSLVPYYGIEEIDNRVKALALASILNKPPIKSKKSKEDKSVTPVAAFVEENGIESPINGELILPPKDVKENTNTNNIRMTVEINIRPQPIKVRMDLNRIGHNITGRLTELGGASNIHTYKMRGVFKNLIVSGVYDNENKASLDRGSYSLMLLENGEKFEGYFSVYDDKKHRVSVMKCILIKKNSGKSESLNAEE